MLLSVAMLTFPVSLVSLLLLRDFCLLKHTPLTPAGRDWNCVLNVTDERQQLYIPNGGLRFNLPCIYNNILVPWSAGGQSEESRPRDQAPNSAARMRLYHSPQVSQNVGHGNRRDRARRTLLFPPPPPPLQRGPRDTEGNAELIVPKKLLLNPALAPQIQRSLHQELLFCYRRGLLPRKRPELQRVLEQRHREDRERRERPLSDLDRHLQTRRLRSRALDSEDERTRRQNEPEFVKVKGALKPIPGFCL